eukprot:1039457-Lingulodinium_polyedra.AAC.1
MVVDACGVRIGIHAALRTWSACPSASLNSSRARFAQKCVQTRIPWLQCRVDTNSHTSCADHRVVVGA